MDLPLDISPKAWGKIQDIMTQKNIPAHYALRLGMRGSGCSGDFFLGFDVPKPEDVSFESRVGKIIIQKTQLLYFYDLALDWVETPESAGFSFITHANTNTR
jgi:iron-sulfur cluster assembly protein